jgi:LuxR family maltose regulon positive regulatory protein
MATPLLQTKLYIPPVRPGSVSRPRLIERLNKGVRLNQRLILISAPAGFGKTTLLGEWVASSERPVAWLSLDEGDNDPARFLAYLVAAFQTIEEGIGEGALGALQSPQPSPMQELLTALINQINAIPRSFVFVLDDYHLITAQPVHDALAFLLDHLPGNMHLVIATRADPPLPIARLRGRGQLTELRQTDLRFTLGEAAEFLNQVMRLELSADDAAALASRTEGWIAGLQMAAVSMRGREDVGSFVHAFTGSNRYILDYLIEEVLQRQPDGIQTFLLQTSILDRLTGPLCDAVVGISESADQRISDSLARPLADSQAVLEYLERANLFVVPLDDRREWYRYHRLFAGLLRQRLHQAQPDLVPILHGRASAWCEQNGLMAEAIDHALSAGDFELATHLVEQAAETAMMHSEVATFLSWTDRLPDELVRTRPSLCLFHAWALLLSGRPMDAVEARLQDAVKADTAASVSGEVTVFRALFAAYQGNTRQSAELSQRALELLPEDSSFFRSLVAGYLGLNYLYVGDVAAATQAFSEAIRIAQQVGNLTIAVLARCHLAELAMLQGQLHEARAGYEQALELATDAGGRQQPIGGLALIGIGRLLREWNNLEAATRYLLEGIELIRKWGEVGAISGYAGLARVKQAQGDTEGVREAIQTAQQLAAKFDAMDVDDLSVAMQRTRLWVMQGDVEAALRWIEGRGLDKELNLGELESKASSASLSLLETLEYSTLAWVRIAQGQPDEALVVLRSLLRAAETAGWTGLVIEILTLQALAHQRQGDAAQALTPLEHALSLAEPEGYVRIFLDKGEAMGELLQQAAARGIAMDYVAELLAALGSETKDERRMTELPPSSSVIRPSSSLVEPLSERELEVLRLLTTHLSSTEMAEELVLSVNTVRSHIKNIYGKLNVHRRMDAIQRARELGLL